MAKKLCNGGAVSRDGKKWTLERKRNEEAVQRCEALVRPSLDGGYNIRQVVYLGLFDRCAFRPPRMGS
jgi:hypothetical protein